MPGLDVRYMARSACSNTVLQNHEVFTKLNMTRAGNIESWIHLALTLRTSSMSCHPEVLVLTAPHSASPRVPACSCRLFHYPTGKQRVASEASRPRVASRLREKRSAVSPTMAHALHHPGSHVRRTHARARLRTYPHAACVHASTLGRPHDKLLPRLQYCSSEKLWIIYHCRYSTVTWWVIVGRDLEIL